MSTDKFIDINNECIICLDIVETEKENIEIFKDCNHNGNYHISCVNEWVSNCIDKKITPTCPICRNEITLSDFNFETPPEQNNHNIVIIHDDRSPSYLNYFNRRKSGVCVLYFGMFTIVYIIMSELYNKN
jgi:hypothetical protein